MSREQPTEADIRLAERLATIEAGDLQAAEQAILDIFAEWAEEEVSSDERDER